MLLYSQARTEEQYTLIVGEFRTVSDEEKVKIESLLFAGRNVVLGIRDTFGNSHTLGERYQLLRNTFKTWPMGTRVKIIIIPDVNAVVLLV